MHKRSGTMVTERRFTLKLDTDKSSTRMTKTIARLAATAALAFSAYASASDGLLQQLRGAAPALNPDVLENALQALACAAPEHIHDARLAVIDYSLPSTTPRLWVFDLEQRALLFKELVAHGRASGDKFSRQFSNTPGSHQSSIGLFRTLHAYDGRNGYSLRMQGLEPKFNHHALERAIVIHGAKYVSDDFITRTGRIGRSHGCPAVPVDAAKPLIDTIKDGHYVFSWYPDPNYIAGSKLLQCPREVAMNGATSSF